MLRTQEHYDALKDVIGRIGVTEVLQALSEIAQGHADIQVNIGLPPGASKLLAAELSELADRYAHERRHEIHKRQS